MPYRIEDAAEATGHMCSGCVYVYGSPDVWFHQVHGGTCSSLSAHVVVAAEMLTYKDKTKLTKACMCMH